VSGHIRRLGPQPHRRGTTYIFSNYLSTLDWLTHSGQAYAAATSYVPLPPQIQQLAHTMLQRVAGPNGKALLG